MNSMHLLEMKALRRDQDHIHALVQQMDDRLDRMQAKLDTPEEPECLPPPLAPVPEPIRAMERELAVPPIFRRPDDEPYRPPHKSEPRKADQKGEAVPSYVPKQSAMHEEQTPLPPKQEEVNHVERSESQEESLEMTLGRVWFVRLGIVMLLTGIVFLGSLAYQSIVPRLGAGGKLAMMALAGGVLGGIGFFLQRRNESVRNYARVLIAGGAATLYYTVYAAHFVEPLRVIESPLVGGIALLGISGVMAVGAHRLRSEPLATLAILLSYYTSSINSVGLFTLYSSLLLTATGVFFFIRHRWTRLSLVSLVATYGSFGWWRYVGAVPQQGTLESPVVQVAFLAGYWMLFTLAAWWTRRGEFPAGVRKGYVTANNSALLALSANALTASGSGSFGWFAMTFGAVLLGISRLAAWRKADDRTFGEAYLIQGLITLSIGYVATLTGYQLALVWALQSAVLFTRGGWHGPLREGSAWLSMIGAVLLALWSLVTEAPHAVVIGAMVAGCGVFNAWWFKKQRETMAFRMEAVSLVALAFLVGSVSLWTHLDGFPAAPWLAVAALALGMFPTIRRLPELAMVGQGLLPVAAMMSAGAWELGGMGAAVIVGAAVALTHWWQRQRRWELPKEWVTALELSAAASTSLASLTWVVRVVPGPEVMAWAAGIGVVWIGAMLATRCRAQVGVGLSFLALAAIRFGQDFVAAHWAVALCPALGFIAFAGLMRWGHRLGEELKPYVRQYRNGALYLAALMLFVWSLVHIPGDWRALFYGVIGAGCALRAASVPALAYVSMAMGMLSGGVMLFAHEDFHSWQNLAALVVYAAAHHYGRKRDTSGVLMVAVGPVSCAAVLGVTVWVYCACPAYGWSIIAPVQWALLALMWFAVGVLGRDRVYRRGAMALLGLGMARVFIWDVWKIDQLYRILSFISLGLVLLLVGYFYNRFAETIRKWL